MHFFSYSKDKKSKKNNNEEKYIYWLVNGLPSHGCLLKLAIVEYGKDSSKDWCLTIYSAQTV